MQGIHCHLRPKAAARVQAIQVALELDSLDDALNVLVNACGEQFLQTLHPSDSGALPASPSVAPLTNASTADAPSGSQAMPQEQTSVPSEQAQTDGELFKSVEAKPVESTPLDATIDHLATVLTFDNF